MDHNGGACTLKNASYSLFYTTQKARKLRGRIKYIQVREVCREEVASAPWVDLGELTLQLLVVQESNLDSVTCFSPTAWHKRYFHKVQVPIVL